MPPVVLRVDKEAFGIARIGRRSGGHRTECGVPEQLVRIPESVDVNEKRRQITRCRNPAAVEIHPGDVHSIRVTPCLIMVFHLIGRAVPQRVSGNLHVDDAAALQNIVHDVLPVGLPADFFDHAPKQAIAEVRVRKGVPRRNGEWHVCQRPGYQLPMVHFLVQKHWIVGIVPPTADSVSKQVLDCNLFNDGEVNGAQSKETKIRRRVIVISKNRIWSENVTVEPQLPCLDEGEDPGRRNRLRYACDPEIGVAASVPRRCLDQQRQTPRRRRAFL